MNLPKKIGDYTIIKELGNGAYGVVYLVKKENEPSNLVLKQISLKNLKPDEKKNIENEANLLKELNSKYIVKYIDSFEKNNYLNIIMEYCDQGDLDLLLKSKKKTNQLIAEKWVWKLFLQISIGLAYLHKKNILHRDLKSLNIFLKGEFEVKIGDLGVAKKLDKQKFAKTFIGTPYYLSPEICEDREYNDKSDVWALGCILYELCTYKHLFEANSQGALILKIMTSPIPNISNCYSEQLRNLVKDILIKDDRKRPSVKDILSMSSVVENAKKFGFYNDVCNVIGKSDKVVILKKNSNVKLNEGNKVKFQSNIKGNHNFVNNNLINEGRFNVINKIGSNNVFGNNYVNSGQPSHHNIESERSNINDRDKNIKNTPHFHSEVNINKNQIKNLDNEINENQIDIKQNKIKIKPIIITDLNDKLNNNNNKEYDVTASSTFKENIKKTNTDINNINNNNINNTNNNNTNNENNNNTNNENNNNNNNENNNKEGNKIPRQSVKKKLRKAPPRKDKYEEFIIEENKDIKINKSKSEKRKINKKIENSDSDISDDNILNKNVSDDSENDDEEETVQEINKNNEKEKILLKIEEQQKELKNLIGLKDFNYINSLYIQTINSNDDSNKYYTEIEKFFNDNYSEEKKYEASSIYFNLVILSIQLRNVELDDD